MNDFLALWADEEKAEQTVSKLRSRLLHRLLPWVRKQNPPIIYLHQLQSEHIDEWKIRLCHLTPALDEKVLQDKDEFERYDQSYRSMWTGTGKKPVASTRLSSFQNEIARDRSTICGADSKTKKVG